MQRPVIETTQTAHISLQIIQMSKSKKENPIGAPVSKRSGQIVLQFVFAFSALRRFRLPRRCLPLR